MSLSLSKFPGTIQPVYSDQEYEFSESTLSGDSTAYYQLIIYIQDGSICFNTLPVNNLVNIDIQKSLQNYFESFILTHSSFSTSDSSSLLSYTGKYRSLNSTGLISEASIGTYYIFNGVDQYNNTWDPSNYIFNGDVSAGFLTNWDAPRDIHINDNIYFQGLSGVFGTIDSSLDQIRITKYQKNGTIDVSIFKVEPSSTPKIVSINLAPSVLNSNITQNTDYYTVSVLNGKSKVYRINIIQEERRYKRYYRIFYVGGLGQSEAFNFDLVPENNINISRNIYVNNKVSKIYGTQVTDSYLVRSNWINENISSALKEIWHSPVLKLVENDELIPIIITDSTKLIKNKWNDILINYELSFNKAEEYKTQKN